MAAGVVVVLFFGLVEDEIIHVVVPYVGVLAIFRSKALGIVHMAKARVVSRQNELYPFYAVGHFVFEAVVEEADELSASVKLLFGRGIVVDAIFFHHHGHKLHKPESPFLALKVHPESRLLIDE